MKRIFLIFLCLFCMTSTGYAQSTNRVKQFSNAKVSVWTTTVYPSAKQKLKMHNHKHDRVVVVLKGGVLKIRNNKGRVHYLKLTTGKTYFLSKDNPHELHTDENIGKKPVKVVVIELR